MKFSIDQAGRYECEIESGERILEKIRTTKSALPCGPIEGVLRYYKKGIKARERHLTETVEETHMGVKVYRDRCRVRPYGEEADDWLDVRSRRARGGGKYYVQPQALAGSVHITASANPELKDATNREAGMLENVDFLASRTFIREHVDKLNDLLERETRSESQKQKR